MRGVFYNSASKKIHFKHNHSTTVILTNILHTTNEVTGHIFFLNLQRFLCQFDVFMGFMEAFGVVKDAIVDPIKHKFSRW